MLHLRLNELVKRDATVFANTRTATLLDPLAEACRVFLDALYKPLFCFHIHCTLGQVSQVSFLVLASVCESTVRESVEAPIQPWPHEKIVV